MLCDFLTYSGCLNKTQTNKLTSPACEAAKEHFPGNMLPASFFTNYHFCNEKVTKSEPFLLTKVLTCVILLFQLKVGGEKYGM
jgi:hypothetical protein